MPSHDLTSKWKLTHILAIFPTLVFHLTIATLLYRSSTAFKPLTSRTGLPFAPLGNTTSPSSFDFHKPFDLPVEITFAASCSTSAAVANVTSLSPPPLFQCCAHLPLYMSALCFGRPIQNLNSRGCCFFPCSLPLSLPFLMFQKLLALITAEMR